MRKPVDASEWRRFLRGELSPEEGQQVANRVTEIDPDFFSVEDDNFELFRRYVNNTLPAEDRDLVEGLCDADPQAAETLQAMQVAHAEVQQSLEWEPVKKTEPAKRSPWWAVLNGGGLALGAAAALFAVAIMLPRTRGLETQVRDLKVKVENLTKNQVKPGDVLPRFGPNSPLGVGAAPPKGSIQGDSYVVSLSDEALVALATGFDLEAGAHDTLQAMKIVGPLEILPGRSFYFARLGAVLHWKGGKADSKYDVTLARAGKTVASASSLEGTEWEPEGGIQQPGRYRLVVTEVLKDGTKTESSAEFEVRSLSESLAMDGLLRGIDDPIGRAAVLAREGYVYDAWVIMDELSKKDPEERLERLRDSLLRAMYRQ